MYGFGYHQRGTPFTSIILPEYCHRAKMRPTGIIPQAYPQEYCELEVEVSGPQINYVVSIADLEHRELHPAQTLAQCSC